MNAWFCQCYKAYLSHIKWLEHLKPLIFEQVIPPPHFYYPVLRFGGGGRKDIHIYMVHQTTTRGVTRMARGGIRLVHGLTKSTLITYFSGMKTDPKYAILHAFFLNLPVMSFPKFVYMTKNTPFFPILPHFCTPKRCTCVHCLVLKNNPNYVNFWDEPWYPLDIRVAPGTHH